MQKIIPKKLNFVFNFVNAYLVNEHKVHIRGNDQEIEFHEIEIDIFHEIETIIFQS